jgi:3-oxoacyl-[acyl-carrier protein] reductase
MSNGRLAIVVGGTGLIGEAIVKTLVRKDCRVASIARHKDRLDEIVKATGGRSMAYQADAADPDEVRHCVDTIARDQGEIDFLVYSAGIAPDPDVPLADYQVEDWDATFDVYVKGFFLFFRETLKVIRPRGHILAVSSAVTRFPPDKLPPGVFVGHYAAAKAALDEFCKWARREAHERSVLLSRLAPSAVDGPFHQNAPPHRRPRAVLPLETVAHRIVQALLDNLEIDEELVATVPS